MLTHHESGRSRRAVLRAGVAVAATVAAGLGVTGCDPLSDEPEPPPPPDPLAPLLAGTVELVARYDAAIAAHPDLTGRLEPIRQAHRAHLTELADLIGAPAPGASGSSTPSATTTGAPASASGALTALRTAEQGARRTAVAACLAAPADRAILLGTIAAARACHAEVLR